MAKQNRIEKDALKFEQTEGKKYGKKPLLDRSNRIRLTDISRPPFKRRKSSAKPHSNGEPFLKNNRGKNRKNRLRLLTFNQFSFIIQNVKQMKGKIKMPNTKTTSKSFLEKAKDAGMNFLRVIIGIGLALSIVSIAWSTYAVWTGTEGIAPKIMVMPQAILASFILIAGCHKLIKASK